MGCKVTPPNRPLTALPAGGQLKTVSGLTILIHSQIFTGAERSLYWHRVGFRANWARVGIANPSGRIVHSWALDRPWKPTPANVAPAISCVVDTGSPAACG